MGIYENLPYTNFHELNLEWMIKKLKSLQEPTEEADRAEAAATAAAASAATAADDADAAAAALASIQSAITDALTPTSVAPAPVDGVTQYPDSAPGMRLYEAVDIVLGQIQLQMVDEVTTRGLLATNFPAPAGGSLTIVGHHVTTAKLGQHVLAHLSREATETYPVANALYYLAGSLEIGDRVVFDFAYLTR